MYLKGLRQVTSTSEKVTTHTACTYKTRDRLPVHVTKLQHKACTYKTRDRSPVHVTKLQHKARTYKTRDRSPVHVTKLQHTACTYALSSIRSITIIVYVVSFILDTTYIGD